MAKRGINNLPRFVIAREGPFYSDDDITAIIDAAGPNIPPKRRNELVRRLEKAAERWIFDDASQRFLTPKMLEKQFTKIERAAVHLLEVIGAGQQGDLESIPGSIIDRLQSAAAKKARELGLGRGGIHLLRESVEGVVQIKRWSASQVQIEIERESERKCLSGVSNPRKTKNSALNNWFTELAQIYSDIWGRKPTVSWSEYTNKYSGPFFEFVRAAKGTGDPGTKAAKCVVGRREMTNIALGKAIQKVTKLMDI